MDRPIVAILAIGNELLRGDVENTNTRWLSARLSERGAHVIHAAIVRDEPEHIAREWEHARRYSPTLVLTTGGLGPTADDLTLRALAAATGRPLEPNPVALAMVAAHYAERARSGAVEAAELTPPRRKMGTLPRGAVPLENRVGAAPGVLLEIEGTTLVCLPGVPEELRHIVGTSLAPVLDRVLGPGIQREVVLLAGTPDESRLAGALAAVSARHPEAYLKSHAEGLRGDGRFRITVSTISSDSATAERAVARAVKDLSAALEAEGISLSAANGPT